MSITRNFKLFLNAGFKVPLVIHANQYDQDEQWIFTLYNSDGTQYTPTTGAIVGMKSDGNLIANAGTVNAAGQVVITETEQMTAAAGKAVFELQIDNETHGTANFVVLVEEDPSDGGTVSASDISLLRRAISGGMSDDAINALIACFQNVAWANDQGSTYVQTLSNALLISEVASISAVFTQGTAVIYDTDDLSVLNDYLVVTATYEDYSTATVTGYTLSGTLTEGTSTITVTYSGKTTTFTVTVSAGLPDTYTEYDYVQVANVSSPSTTVNVAPPESWIVLKGYDNLDVLSWDFKFKVVTGYTQGSALIGTRMDSGIATGDAVYVGSVAASAVGQGDYFRMIAKGNYQAYSSEELVVDDVNEMIFTNTSASPSYYYLNGVQNTLTWTEELTVTRGLTLFTNPTPSAATMTLQRYQQIGRLKLYDLDENLVGDYVPAVRTSDNVIGMFDLVEQTFYTTSTAKYATIGNASCYYTVGNWS